MGFHCMTIEIAAWIHGIQIIHNIVWFHGKVWIDKCNWFLKYYPKTSLAVKHWNWFTVSFFPIWTFFFIAASHWKSTESWILKKSELPMTLKFTTNWALQKLTSLLKLCLLFIINRFLGRRKHFIPVFKEMQPQMCRSGFKCLLLSSNGVAS